MYWPRTGTVPVIKYLEKPKNWKAQMDSGAGSIGVSAASRRYFCHSLTNICSVGESTGTFSSAILVGVKPETFYMLKYYVKIPIVT